jgi:FkbM family methyltransferase
VKAGDVIWDVGAHIGLFALTAAVCSGHLGKVFVFEPDLWFTHLLRLTSAAQRPGTCARITVFSAAVGSDVSVQPFSIAVRSRRANKHPGDRSSRAARMDEKYLVATYNLDLFLRNLPRPNIVKLDVGGAELAVLHGQWKILGDVRPVIIRRVDSRGSEDITMLLTLTSYCLFDGDKSLNKAKRIDRATWNTIAIPEERKERRLDFCGTTPQRFCFRHPIRSSSVCSSAGRQTHVLQCRLPADWRTTKVAVCSTPSWMPILLACQSSEAANADPLVRC